MTKAEARLRLFMMLNDEGKKEFIRLLRKKENETYVKAFLRMAGIIEATK